MEGQAEFRIVAISGEHPVRISCTGELDLATGPVLYEALDPIDDDVLIDCDGLAFIDSSGIGVLAAQQARLKKRGHRLRLTGLDGVPRRALEVIGMLDELT